MAKSNLKKTSDGYGYKYTDLAEIHNHLEQEGMSYYQYVEPVDGVDYIWTVPIIDGKEMPARRGCRIVEAKLSGKENPVQAYGASLTYCRRYSLLMAMGLATTDDDAACLTVTTPAVEEPKKEDALNILKATAKELGVPEEDILKKGKVKKLEDMNLQRINNCIRWLNSGATA